MNKNPKTNRYIEYSYKQSAFIGIFGALCFLLGILGISFTYYISGDLEIIQQINQKIQECEKDLPRNQVCYYEIVTKPVIEN